MEARFSLHAGTDRRFKCRHNLCWLEGGKTFSPAWRDFGLAPGILQISLCVAMITQSVAQMSRTALPRRRIRCSSSWLSAAHCDEPVPFSQLAAGR